MASFKLSNPNELSKLVDRRLTLKRLMAQENQFSLEEDAFRYVQVAEQCLNPGQIIFPEEIWEIIFDCLDKPEDVWSCYASCRLFKKLLQPKSHLWLFRKVLPVMLNGNYLPIDSLFKCRQTSKSWRRMTDNYLESEESWFTPESAERIEVPHPIKRYHYPREINNQIMNHPRNPFLTRAIYLNYDRPLDNPQSFLESVGNHIWYVKISAESSFLFEKTVNMCLSLCPNLKKLELYDKVTPTNYSGYNPYASSAFKVTSTAANLTTIEFNHRDATTSDSMIIQNVFVEKFSAQLKHLRVRQWNPRYSQCDWPRLTSLHLECESYSIPGSATFIDTTKILKTLIRLKATKLKALSMKFSGESEPNSLQLLLQAINHFSLLEELDLQFDWQWAISESEINSIPVTLPDVCSASLRSLTVRTGCGDRITYSFLIFFPYLRSLHIYYACPVLDRAGNLDDPTWIGHSLTRGILSRNMYSLTEDKREEELVQFREHMYTKRKEIVNLKLWNILPFLQRVQLTDYVKSWGKYYQNTQTFTRN